MGVSEEKIRQRRDGGFRVVVPVEAPEVEPEAEDQELRVVGQTDAGYLAEQTMRLGRGRRGSATLTFPEAPRSLKVFVGPSSATAEELVNSQTISVGVPIRQVGKEREIKLAPIAVAPYFWHWWLRWCRTFVIRGRVVCADGTPVPGAEVCAYDVDWWFFWNSQQQVGCQTTDINGAFEMKFRWCCGWWPWWWWTHRVWIFDEVLTQRVGSVISAGDLPLKSIGTRPSLETFENLLDERTGSELKRKKSLQDLDAAELEVLRKNVLQRFPQSEEMTRLHIWPWWPWWPWSDCTPDIIFKVNQHCGDDTVLIVDEGIGDTRWDIPTMLDVTLVANEDACCLAPPEDDTDCLILDRACGISFADIGGNPGAAPTPAGYASPGNGDRPFAGSVTIEKAPGDITGTDFIEIEVFNGAAWVPLPMGAELSFNREYFDQATSTGVAAPFPVQTIAGHRVWETRRHYEATSGVPWWPTAGWDRAWMTLNYSLMAYIDSSKFGDGTYRFRAVGWADGGAGVLKDRRVLPLCGEDQKDNEFWLTFDNRVIDPVTHPASHNCGPVHICTVEPDTHISAVRINGVQVDPCDVADAKGSLEIDFEVTDPNGHLESYSLNAHFGLSGLVNLLLLGTVTAISADFVGETYNKTRTLEGNPGPGWFGGQYRLTIAESSKAFEVPCCYLLRLTAYKRTIVGCYSGHAHWNQTEYTLGIGVCS